MWLRGVEAGELASDDDDSDVVKSFSSLVVLVLKVSKMSIKFISTISNKELSTLSRIALSDLKVSKISIKFSSTICNKDSFSLSKFLSDQLLSDLKVSKTSVKFLSTISPNISLCTTLLVAEFFLFLCFCFCFTCVIEVYCLFLISNCFAVLIFDSNSFLKLSLFFINNFSNSEDDMKRR